jgi:hypothetical protein
MDGTSCSRTGDADLLGIGVRLGFYLEMLAVFIFCIKTMGTGQAAFLETFSALLLAILMGVSVAIGQGTVSDVDLVLISWLGYATCVVLYFPFQTLLSMLRQNPTSGAKLRWPFLYSIIGLWYSCIMLWFWSVGFKTLQSPGCETFIFFFARVPAYGGFRIFVLLMAASGAGSSVIMLKHLYEMVTHGSGPLVEARLPSSIASPSRIRRAGMGAAPGLAACYGVYVVLGTELTLMWNGVSGAYMPNNTGQIIPLVIGVFSVVAVICDTEAAITLDDFVLEFQKALREDGTAERQENDTSNSRDTAPAAAAPVVVQVQAAD